MIRLLTVMALSALTMGCASSKKLPRPIAVLDVYLVEEGFIVISEQGTDESIAIRFNVGEVYE